MVARYLPLRHAPSSTKAKSASSPSLAAVQPFSVNKVVRRGHRVLKKVGIGYRPLPSSALVHLGLDFWMARLLILANPDKSKIKQTNLAKPMLVKQKETSKIGS
jgi:hypothetical protein